MFGLSFQKYREISIWHGKINVLLWSMTVIVYRAWTGGLVTPETVLLIFPGFVMILFLSILTVFVKVYRIQIVPQTKRISVKILFNVLTALDYLFPVAAAIGAVYLLEMFI